MIFTDLTLINRLTDQANLTEIESYIKPVKGRVRPDHLIRNPLMISAIKPNHLNKTDELNTDIAVINLEDGISASQKPVARVLAAYFISAISPEKSGPFISVRVNPLHSGGLDDIKIMNQVKPHAIRIPKIISPDEVDLALRSVDEDIEIHLSIETKDAFQNIGNLKKDKRVTLFYLGLLDLLADMNIPQSLIESGSKTIDYILVRFFTETKLAGAEPVSSVYQNYRDTETFRKMCINDRAIGFRGKSCISPAQAVIAGEIFSPDLRECEKATAIRDLFEANLKMNITGFSHETFGFVDEPVYRDALLTLKNCR
jgi:citrate lyase subunit beta / citryl-CoA lyase